MEVRFSERERFAAIMGSHPRPMLLFDGASLEAANDAACIFFGFSEAALRTAGVSAFSGDPDGWEGQLLSVLDGTAMVGEWADVVRCATGTRGVQLRGTGVRSSGGGPDRWLAVVEIDVAIDRSRRSADARQARSRYERLVDAAQEGIWEVDVAGRTVFANPRMAEILGCEVGELIGRSMFDFFDSRLAVAVETKFATIREGRTDRFVARCRRQDGRTVWLMTSAIPLFDEDGTWSGAAATAVDITEKRRHDEALRAAEEMLRRTFDGAPIGSALVGLDGRWMKLNDAACQMLGRPAEELLGLTFQEVTHPEDLDGDLELLKATVDGQRTGYSIEKRYVRPGGAIVWATLTVALVRDERNLPLFFVTQLVDITDRKLAEQERDRARDHLQRLLDRTAVAMAIVDPAGDLIGSNARFRELFPAVDDLVGLTVSVEEGSRKALRRLIAEAGQGSTGTDVVLADGSDRVLQAVAMAEEDGSLVLQVTDVTTERGEHHRLRAQALLDPLTGLVNRRGLAEAMDRMVPEGCLGVVFLDLDGFKVLNDTVGHDRGDQLLAAVADRIASTVRSVDIAGRLGGDEFVILLPGGDLRSAEQVADRVVDEIRRIQIGEGIITASAGLAFGVAADPRRLLRQADRAMLEAKAQGKDLVVLAG